jgi:DUF2075 family protein/predicted GIY-YIG superfamily endonuclease
MITKNAFEIKRYEFNADLLYSINSNHYVNGLWPLVYIISNESTKEAYVGETTDAISRMSNHLKNDIKSKLTAIHLITSDKFNKSATLDIESNLIKYLSGDGQYKLLNANIGLANHTYYQKSEVYWDIFQTIWSELRPEGIAKKTLDQINNSDLFKYSPYKSLTPEQKISIIEIIKSLLDNTTKSIVVEGGAGTGKTILAIYLFKILSSDITDFNFKEFGKEEAELIELVNKLKTVYPSPKMALVVPMSSFRTTLQKVFKNIRGLSAKMVIGPAEVANSEYDLLIVDESHRLRKRVNLGAYFGAFDKANEKLGLDKMTANELDWIVLQGKKKIFFYDENQSIKPSDVDKSAFENLKFKQETTIKTLKSQFRVKGGNGYVAYVDQLLNCSFKKTDPIFEVKDYEFLIFESLQEMIEKIKSRDAEFGLSRLVAGYSWEWVSKNKDEHDILIDGIKLKWNSVSTDWVNSENSINEVGCIHTTQGYDLNFTGVIFGNEISYDKAQNQIVIKKENYFDTLGKQSIKNPDELKAYIINIYKTIMLRGIRGTYVYVCDEHLRAYLKEHIKNTAIEKTIKILPLNEVKPYVNCVPLYDLWAAAGAFSDSQTVSDFEWIALPEQYQANRDYFVCKVQGESMNKKIPNNSWCLFKKDPGGSREGKIVLVEHHNIHDVDFGSGYTVKMYHSEKEIDQDGYWSHQSIVLKPLSDRPDYSDIILHQDELTSLKVVGVFVAVLA